MLRILVLVRILDGSGVCCKWCILVILVLGILDGTCDTEWYWCTSILKVAYTGDIYAGDTGCCCKWFNSGGVGIILVVLDGTGVCSTGLSWVILGGLGETDVCRSVKYW